MVVNPATGERLIFRQTAADTGGELVELEAIITPDGACAGAHVHPHQEERFEVLEGLVGFRLGRKKTVAEPGDTVVVPAGTVHRFWNAGDIDARFVCQVTPALQFEALIETMFGLAADGKTTKKGIPNPLRLAVIANAHWDGLRAPYVPSVLQRVGLKMGSAAGRAMGYSAQYEGGNPVIVGDPTPQSA
jgi:mannose-6-phosphate isomerase-like protein (cupin superfamily)